VAQGPDGREDGALLDAVREAPLLTMPTTALQCVRTALRPLHRPQTQEGGEHEASRRRHGRAGPFRVLVRRCRVDFV
jgi:hypothetical protein